MPSIYLASATVAVATESTAFLATIVEVPLGVLVLLFVLIVLPTEDLIAFIQYALVRLFNYRPR